MTGLNKLSTRAGNGKVCGNPSQPVTQPADLHKRNPFLRAQATNSHAPGWLRVTLWCWGHATFNGHACALPGQLQDELGFTSAREVSRALRLARERHLIDACSTSACVVVPGHSRVTCPAHHRGVS